MLVRVGVLFPELSGGGCLLSGGPLYDGTVHISEERKDRKEKEK